MNMLHTNVGNVNTPAPTKHEIEANPERPRIKAPRFSNLPDCIRQLDHWVYWTYCWTDRWTKIPYQIVGHYGPDRLPQFERASHADPETWASFDDVALNVFAREDRGVLGIGFCPHDNDEFAFIDLDNCRNCNTGEIADRAMAVVKRLDTYTEISESGTGLKLLLKGKKPGNRCRSKTQPGIEIYDRAHFTALTGNRLPGTPADILLRQAELTSLYQEIFPGPEPSGQTIQKNAPARAWTPTPDNTDLLLKRARNYVQTIPGAIAGQRGHDQTFKTACALVIGFDLPIHDAAPILNEWNCTCSPPWSEADLMRKLREADNQPGARGKLRDANNHSTAWSDELASLAARGVNVIEVDDDGLTLAPASAPPALAHAIKPPTLYTDLAAFVPTAESSNEREAEVAAAIKTNFYDLNKTPCPTPYFQLQEHKITRQPRRITIRCRHRDCEGSCCEWLNNREIANARFRFTEAERRGQMLYTLTSSAECLAAVKKRIKRSGGEYLAVCDNGRESWTIFTTADLAFSMPIASGDALDSFAELVRAFAGLKRPVQSSRGWKLPTTERPNDHHNLGRITEQDRDYVDEIAATVDATTEIKVPRTNADVTPVLAILYFNRLAGWHEEGLVEHLHHCLKMGEAIPFSLEVEEVSPELHPEASIAEALALAG